MKQFNYLEETKTRRLVGSLILYAIILLLVGSIGMMFVACIKKFSLVMLIMTLVVVLMAGICILTLWVFTLKLNKQCIVTFNEDTIQLDNDIVNKSDIRFIGSVKHSAPGRLVLANFEGRGFYSIFEIQTVDNIYRPRMSKECRKYLKEYCKAEELRKNPIDNGLTDKETTIVTYVAWAVVIGIIIKLFLI